MMTYLCPRCLSVTVHHGTLLSQCSDFYDGCPTWAVAIAWRDNQPLRGSHLAYIPYQGQPFGRLAYGMGGPRVDQPVPE